MRREGREAEVPVEALTLEDVVVVRPGVRLPVDGGSSRGRPLSTSRRSPARAFPSTRARATSVFAGSVNGEGALEVKVTRLAKDSTLSRVMQLVEEAQGQKPRTQRTVEAFTARLVPAVLLVAVLLIVVPPLFGVSFEDSFLAP